MKKDAEVQLLLHERHKGRTQAQAAARAGVATSPHHQSRVPDEGMVLYWDAARLQPLGQIPSWIGHCWQIEQ